MKGTVAPTWSISFLALLGLLAAVLPAKASQIMGSDIRYECIKAGADAGKIKVSLAIYRDCNGNNLNIGPLTVKCGTTTKTVSTTSTGGAAKDITPVCHKGGEKHCTKCLSNGEGSGPECDFAYGAELFEAYAIVDPTEFDNGCEFTFSWGQCCRNVGINNLSHGTFYIEATYDWCRDTGCSNSSPYFANPPVAFFCKGQCIITLNPFAADDDVVNGRADSLVYKLVPAMNSAGQSAQYAGGYTSDEPLDYDGIDGSGPTLDWDPPKKCKGFGIDPFTGDLSFRPMSAGAFVVAYSVEEWRYGQDGSPFKMGETRRDLQIIVTDCPNNHVPLATSAGDKYLENFCVNVEKCFTIRTFDADPDDSVTIEYNPNNPLLVEYGATFEIFHSKWPTGRFCWKPDSHHARSLPYSFRVTLKDDACPVSGRSSYNYRIMVYPELEATWTTSVDTCGNIALKAFPVSDPPGHYKWNIDAPSQPITFSGAEVDNIKVRDTGWIPVRLTLSNSGCATTYYDSVYVAKVDTSANARFTAARTAGRSYTFTAQKPGLNSYEWAMGDGTALSGESVAYAFAQDSVYTVSLTVANANGCTATYDTVISVAAHIGMAEAKAASIGLKVVPNPFHNDARLEFSLPKQSRVKVFLMSMSGQHISTIAESSMNGSQSISLGKATAPLAPGVYLVGLHLDGELYVVQVVKKD